MTNKFISPCPLPTPHEAEILTILAEECAEVIQRAAKLIRFGRDEIQPGQPLTNRQRLSQELGEVQGLVWMAAELELVSQADIARHAVLKEDKVRKFLQTETERE